LWVNPGASASRAAAGVLASASRASR
jgi:hypothetical protein